ncbi:hypothetical protein Clacol_001967 [Clathrus columnatus]|uniref:Cytochrome P450 n=1 Tax=Clathrus columnatus TaxID=1419009 RepID=A0AAV5A2C2_9AGAM|nr:hypothetical protein Clacol_001967 [Clathrus columnatus]
MSSTDFDRLSQSLSTGVHFNEHLSTCSWIGFTLLTILLAFRIFKPDPLAHIPAVGGTGSIYRVPDKDRWHIIVSRADQIKEFFKTPDDILSVNGYIDTTFFISYLMGPTLMSNLYHVGIVRSQLNRNLGTIFNDLRNEIHIAFDDNIRPTDDWTAIHAYPKMVEVVARASNRIFVGLPMYACYRPRTGISQNQYRLCFEYKLSKSVAIAAKHLGPVIKERQDKIDAYGHDYPEKPVDILSWLMEEAVGEERSIENLTKRILSLNFAAVHTTSMVLCPSSHSEGLLIIYLQTFTSALYHLAAEPHYIPPMREEIERVIAEEGWTKTAMTKMRKLDSFLKENLRHNVIHFVSSAGLTLKDFTFSDGTVIPKGSVVSAAVHPAHYNEENYPDSEKFDGFRYAKIRAQDGYNNTNQLVNTSLDYLSFGHGKHACPGRFFAGK